ncbi:MAG: type II/IV secretion system protein [Burkholderiaceae bacterium]|nr:type II/IV secretion system protein [Burkholderiaceae bacterium]
MSRLHVTEPSAPAAAENPGQTSTLAGLRVLRRGPGDVALVEGPSGRMVLLADADDAAARQWAALFARTLGPPRLCDATALRLLAGPAATERQEAPEQSADGPAVRLLDSLLDHALHEGASDLHLEATPEGLLARCRLDGVMLELGRYPGREAAEQLISRLKVLAELDIAERRVPQDGRLQHVNARGRTDLRVSIMPSLHGEDAVLRVLEQGRAAAPELGSLGFAPAVCTRLRQAAERPHGLLLVTGPTGSGKTSTLYAVIRSVLSGLDKIISIEDPVEYQLPGVLQIPVNEKKGLTFARGLRSILRHDPDKIFVGEIRDAETAGIAVQSALTGHLVFSSLHANDAFEVMGRLRHLGIDAHGLASALHAVLAQRLLRRVCLHCTAAHRPEPALLQRLGLPSADWAGTVLRMGRGCAHCRGTGYLGRQAVGELVLMDERLRELLLAGAAAAQLRAQAQRAGTQPLREAALDLVRTGVTTLEEVLRVTVD